MPLHVLEVTTSTQTDAKARMDAGAQLPFAVVAEEQTQGRGRLDRTWTAPRYSSLLLSVALPQPAVATAFTLRVGVAVASALRAQGADVRLKWPNDIVVLVDGAVRKLGGILAERHAQAIVTGMGLNVDLHHDELPTESAISCRQLGGVPRREELLQQMLEAMLRIPEDLDEYRRLCISIGADVAATLADGTVLQGRVTNVDGDGALVLDVQGVVRTVTVGDVQHLRTAS